MGYIGRCRCEGWGLPGVYSGIGYINQEVWVKKRVTFPRKLINWLKILVKTRESGNWHSKKYIYIKNKSASLNLRNYA